MVTETMLTLVDILQRQANAKYQAAHTRGEVAEAWKRVDLACAWCLETSKPLSKALAEFEGKQNDDEA